MHPARGFTLGEILGDKRHLRCWGDVPGESCGDHAVEAQGVVDAVIVDVDAGEVPLAYSFRDRSGVFRAQLRRAKYVVDDVRVERDDARDDLVRGGWNGRRGAGEITGVGRGKDERVEDSNRGFSALVERGAGGNRAGDLQCCLASLED